jgi:dipeptidyl aminopeptidase/acylaminoacyl peptidase
VADDPVQLTSAFHTIFGVSMPRRTARIAFAIALAPLPRLLAQQPSFTLEQVMSAPFPDELTAAPVGGAVAWVFNARGARNVWVAAPPEYQGRPVTAYAEDDGQEVADLHWLPDARAIAYVRGGEPNGHGEYPNPRSLVKGVEQAVWLAPLAGGAPRRVGQGNSPAVSPKGDRIAFLKQGQIWWASVGDTTPAEQLIHARGSAGSLRWSPDGSKLAFVSDRGDHAFVVVYDVAAKTLRFLDPSVDSDAEPVWSPDGRRIAFLRVPAGVGGLPFTPARAGQPWSIRVADAATGAGRQVWVADTGRGSVFREIVAANQLVWGAGERIVFPWEKDGWTHLYSVPAGGGAATLLTPGAFEVEHVAASGDGATLVFSSNQDDIDRRHVWKVTVAGGAPAPAPAPTAVTRGADLEWMPVMTSDGKGVAFIHASTRKPPRPAILVGATPRDLAPAATPGDFPEAALVEPQPVLFAAADGLTIHGQLFLPRGLKTGERRPAVIFFHGGSRRQMLLGWHYFYYYRNAYALNQYLASRGYVVLSVNYRSGIGYGMEFREALHYGAQGASEFNDVLGAGLYLRGRPDVDAKRIGLWGGSYGGFLTALGLARASDQFAAGVDLHGVHDWNIEIQNWVPTYDPQKRADAAQLAHQSSPIAYVKDWRSPVLLVHGDDDRNVQFSQSVQLAAALREQGVAVEQLIFPDEIHDFLTHADWLAAYRAAAEFFERKLGR